MNSIELKSSAACVTWAVVSICALYVHYQLYGLQALLWISLLLQLLIGGGIVLTIHPGHAADRPLSRYLGLALQAVGAIALNFTMDQSFLTIYTIIMAGQLPHLLRLRPALLCVGAIMGSYYCVWHFYWHAPSALLDTLLWSTFHLFSLLLNHSLNRERLQKEQAIAINQELKGTQSLLQEAAKHDERLRIARDLHDRLGHQLTALSIQLDVLRRSCPPAQQPQVEASYTLAQELLQSIRSSVSDMRDNHSVDIASALKTLVEGLPDIEVELDWPSDIRIDSLQQAESLFYCVQEASTNTLKHAHASRLLIKARMANGQLEAWVHDNGQYSRPLVPGNGFKGMAERMATINGQLDWQAGNPGLIVHLSAPLMDKP